MILTYDRLNTFIAHATVYHHSITASHHRIITPAMILTNDETFQNICFHSAASSLAFLFVKCNKTFVEKYWKTTVGLIFPFFFDVKIDMIFIVRNIDSFNWKKEERKMISLMLTSLLMANLGLKKRWCVIGILSTWHFVNLAFCQLGILSTWCFVDLRICSFTFRQLGLLSTWQFSNWHCHFGILST